jgi:hypothetical protein
MYLRKTLTMNSKTVARWVALLGICIFSPQALAAGTTSLWTDVSASNVMVTSANPILPDRGRTMALNVAGMTALLSGAPLEISVAAPDSAFELELPLPEGGFSRFRVVESSIMEPGLAKRYPMLKTYLGQGIDNPTATARFDLTTRGFRAQVIANTHTSYIEPIQPGDLTNYTIFNKADYQKPDSAFTCGVTGQEVKSLPNLLKRNNIGNLASGANLRTYRLAVAATGEYTAALGGTVLDGLSGIITTMNRVNGIYERELAVRMVLVANNDLLIYTDGVTDPYTNDVARTMMGENQANLNTVIGNASFDIGHVFSTAGGGVAGLGVVCNSTQKGRGTTGLPNPRADGFDVDLVAHEMGHQFDGDHTFNGSGGFCGANRNASTAYEVGGGVTIQSYSGTCATSTATQPGDNVQSSSEDYFHRVSLDQMLAFSTNAGSGASCGVLTSTGNAPPTVTTAPAWTIPKSTPFTLTASGNDANGDPLTYSWEQFDLGAANAEGVLVDNGGPLFRNFAPTADPTRTFPSLRYILNNANVAPATAPLLGTTSPNYMTGELLPSTARTMNFRVTVRDNRGGGGGTNDAATLITVAGTAGPFTVTQPNTAVSWAAGSIQTVTWSVASTDIAPVSAANVQIALSIDGGFTFPTILAVSTPNNGSANVTIPAGTPSTPRARIRVAAVGNVFFDISDVNFTVTGANTAPTITLIGSGSVSTRQGAPSVTGSVATVADTPNPAGSLTVAVSQVPPELVVTVVNNAGTVNLTATAACSLVAPRSGSISYPVLLTVTDSGGATTSQYVNVLVGTNQPPTLGTYNNVNLLVGTSTTVIPNAAIADPNNNLATASVSPSTLPGGGTVTIAANGNVTVASTAGTTLGTYTIRAQANDVCGAARVRQFTVSVLPPSPVISIASRQVLTGSGSVQPNQCNQLNVTLTNGGFGTASNVTGTLTSSTPGVTIAQGTANFGAMTVGQSSTNLTPFQFSTANTLTCAANVAFNLTVNYTGGGSPAVLPLNLVVGAPAAPVTQSFDAVSAPALPADWSTSRTGTTPPALWATTATAPDSAPNVAFTNGAASVATNSLVSQAFVLPASATPAVLSFRHAWNFEADVNGWYDGGVLELSSDGGTTFNNVTSVAVGGTFTSGGYSGTISSGFGSPLAGQTAWSGVQGSFVTSTLQLPLALNGQTVRFRFRAGWDDGVTNAGANWRVDGLSLQAGYSCTAGAGACNVPTFTVGGTVTGLTGSGLVLRNNGGNNLNVAGNGAFTFTTPVGTGSPYAVTVLTRPSLPSQGCNISNGSAVMAGANVTNVAVNCVTQTLNIDDSDAPDAYSAGTDGVLLLRYLFGLRGAALTQGATGTNPRRNTAQIEAYIAANLTAFDVDGDTTTKATTDGLLILRRLLGLSGPALTTGARNSSRTDTDVGIAIDALRP